MHKGHADAGGDGSGSLCWQQAQQRCSLLLVNVWDVGLVRPLNNHLHQAEEEAQNDRSSEPEAATAAEPAPPRPAPRPGTTSPSGALVPRSQGCGRGTCHGSVPPRPAASLQGGRQEGQRSTVQACRGVSQDANKPPEPQHTLRWPWDGRPAGSRRAAAVMGRRAQQSRGAPNGCSVLKLVVLEPTMAATNGSGGGEEKADFADTRG